MKRICLILIFLLNLTPYIMDGNLTLTCMNQAMAQMMGGEYVCEDEWGEEYPSSLPCDEEACIAACSTCGEQFNCDESHFCDWITCSVCYTQYIRGQGHSCTVVGDNNENENSGNNGSGGSGGSFGTGGGSNTGGNSSNGGESSNTSPPTITGGTTEQRAIIQSVVNELISVYNLNMNGINIQVIDQCAVLAKISDGYTGIEVCNEFFTYTTEDQTSILWHEMYHYNNDDKSWKDLEDYIIEAYNVTPPADIDISIKYLIEEVEGIPRQLYDEVSDKYINNPAWDYMYYYRTLINDFKNPIYTENEINAYEVEINKFTHVSERYRHERIHTLWMHKERMKKFNDLGL